MIEDSDKSPEAHEDLDPVRVAREAVAQMYEGSLAERMAAVVREGSLDNNPYYPVKDAILGARAMKAACEAAGAKPVAQLRAAAIQAVYHFADVANREGSVHSRSDAYARADQAAIDAICRLAACAHPPAVAAGRVEVKKLEWVSTALLSRFEGRLAIRMADTVFGTYAVEKESETVFVLTLSGITVGDHQGYPTPEAAKAAAQADYEQRILSALEGGGAQEDVPLPLYKRVEAILDEHSAWIARPNEEVTKRIALSAMFAAHSVLMEDEAPEDVYLREDHDVVPGGAGLDLEDDPAPALNLHDAYRREHAAKQCREAVDAVYGTERPSPTPAPGQYAGLVDKLRNHPTATGWMQAAADAITALEADNKAKDTRIAELERKTGYTMRVTPERSAEHILTIGRLTDELAALRGEVERIKSDREYIIGFNHGWEEAVAQTLTFPAMLRKMWSGGEVQAWIDKAMSEARAALATAKEG